MSKIQDIIDNEQGRNVMQDNPVFEAQERNIALLKALDVIADELNKINKAVIR